MNNDLYLTRMTLINQVKNPEDEAAWDEFCTFYWDLIINWARQLGCSNTLAKDIFQETIISLMRRFPDFEYNLEKGRFRSFLKTIVKRRIYDAYRKEGKYVAVSPIKDDANEFDSNSVFDKFAAEKSEITFEHDFIWLDSLLRSSIRRTSEKLDKLTYQSFKMYVLEEKPVEEVAKELKISRVGTVYQHKSRFLTAMKDEFLSSLKEMNNEESPEFNKLNEKIFSQALSRVVAGRIDLRGTMTDNGIPALIKIKLDFIQNNIPSQVPPSTEGAYFLLILKDTESKWFKLRNKFSVGRSEDSDITLNFDDISLVHLSISLGNNDYTMKDENSSNGTYLNGELLEEATFLKNGDIVHIGSEASLVFFE